MAWGPWILAEVGAGESTLLNCSELLLVCLAKHSECFHWQLG